MSRKRTGLLEERGGIWYARLTVYVDGKRTRPRYCLETEDRSIAERKLEKLLDAVPATAEEGPRRPRRFAQWAEEWLSARERRGVAMAQSERILLEKHALPRIGRFLLGDVGTRRIRQLLDAAVEAGLSKQSVHHLRAVLHRCFRAAVVDELLGTNPVREVRSPEMHEVRKERAILRDEETMRLVGCDAVDLEIRVAALASRSAGGMRTRDLTAWRWDDIELPGMDSCVVHRTKTKKPQRIEIPDVLQPSMRAWWTAHGEPRSGPVFPVTKGKRKGEARKTRGVSFAKRLRRALFKAGVTRLPPVETAPGKLAPDPRDPLYHETATSLPVDFHSGRRAFRTALDRAGVDTKTAMLLGGWADEKAADRYNMRGDEALRIPAAALPAVRRSKDGSKRDGGLLGQRGRADGSHHSGDGVLREVHPDSDAKTESAVGRVDSFLAGRTGVKRTHERVGESGALKNEERDTRFELATLSLGSWRPTWKNAVFAEKIARRHAKRGHADHPGSPRVIRHWAQNGPTVRARRRCAGHTFLIAQAPAAPLPFSLPLLPPRTERRVVLVEALVSATARGDSGAARLLWVTVGAALRCPQGVTTG